MRLITGLIALSGIAATYGQIKRSDIHEAVNPGPAEEQLSPNGQFKFRVEAVNQSWLNLKSTGTLLRKNGTTWVKVWQQELPNSFRPRFFLVSLDGVTITFDDWENTESLRAIILYDAHGKLIRQVPFATILAVTNQSLTSVVEAAKFGLWITEKPGLTGHDIVSVGVAKGWLDLNLTTGELSYRTTVIIVV